MPTTAQPDPTCDLQSGGFGFAFLCTGSELGHMFYEHLGGIAGESALDQRGDTAEVIANLALFVNMHSGLYWSGTEFTPGVDAWLFNIHEGDQFYLFSQDDDGQSGVVYAVAVRSGDVAAVVPEVQTYAMLLAGLGALAVVVRRRPV